MSDLDIIEKLEAKMEEVLNSSQRKKSPILNLEFLVKAGFTLVMGSLAYAGMSYKIDAASSNIIDMRQYQQKQDDKWEIQRSSINTQIQTCQTEIAVMKVQIKEIQDNQK